MIIICVARSSSGGLWNTKNVRMLARFRQLGHIPASLSRPVDHKSDSQLEMNMIQKTFTKHSMMQTCDQYQDTIRFTTQKLQKFNSCHIPQKHGKHLLVPSPLGLSEGCPGAGEGLSRTPHVVHDMMI
jgi:hypothetical protein